MPNRSRLVLECDFLLQSGLMALSPQDKAYYEDKLGWKGCLYLIASTVVIGAVAWPLLLYTQDWTTRQEGSWTLNTALEVSMSGAALGMLVSSLMYLVFRVLLMQGWLPRRR